MWLADDIFWVENECDGPRNGVRERRSECSDVGDLLERCEMCKECVRNGCGDGCAARDE